MTQQKPVLPELACTTDAIPQEQRAEHQETTKRIFKAVLEVQELPTGYALRLPNENKILYDIIAFISNERLCCPFFHFALEVEAEQGPVWLRLTGTTDVKAIIQSQEFILATGFHTQPQL